MKKILFLSNVYHAEMSFIKEMQNNPDYDIFTVSDVVDSMLAGRYDFANIPKLFSNATVPCSQANINQIIGSYKPDIIIVRSWTAFANLALPNSVFWKIESYARDFRGQEVELILPNPASSYFCTQNPVEVPLYQQRLSIPVGYFPRGVSHYWDIPSKNKTVSVMTAGTAVQATKVESFNMLIKPLCNILSPEELHIHISYGTLAWASRHLKPVFRAEEGAQRIANSKIFISPVTTRFDPGILSHKTLQSMGCRTLTMTQHYDGVENIVGKDGENLIYADSPEEALSKVQFYLKHDSEREKIAERGYEFAHGEYNFTKVFERAMKQVGVL